MISFKNFLLESRTPELESIARQYFLKLHTQWSAKFPEEPGISDPVYMEPEFDRALHGVGFWMFEQLKKGQFQSSTKIKNYPASAEKCSTKIGRCYYNAVDFVMRNGTQYGDLAYAVFIDLAKLQQTLDWISTASSSPRPHLFDMLEHAVIIAADGSIIDPTLKTNQRGTMVIYEKIPESTWRKFKYVPDDANFDARDFYDEYVLKKIEAEKVSWNFKTWIHEAS